MNGESLRERMLARERVANIRKHWVRLVTACNSRCLFCLDTDTPRNVYIPEEDVRQELRRGREELNADKAILSGGEGSLHPKFIDFIRYAREIGYTRVQTVTNGMMLSKRDFFRRAVDAGLDEITFSLHGHNAPLHDFMTGTPGAFDKLMKGMIRAKRDGRVIVNVDVCINKQNVAYIDRIVELCLSVGVTEFDLLHVIPQGAAFENRDLLFYDPKEYLPKLQKVFRLNRHPGVVVWTNRFPVEFLEGLEDLIQDPHKMLDEVNGRRFQYRRYLDEGTPLECRERERCQYCFIEPFCNTADRFIGRQNRNEWDVWWIGKVDLSESWDNGNLGLDDLPYGSRFLGFEVNDLSDLEQLPVRPEVGLYVKMHTATCLPGRREVPNRMVLSLRDAAQLATILGLEEIPAGVEIEIELNQQTAPWLLTHRDLVERHLAHLRIHQPSYEFLKEATSYDVRNPRAFFEQLDLRVRVSGLPACVTPNVQLAEPLRVLHKSLFDPQTGRMTLRELARNHVIYGYHGKSVRCRDCVLNDRCDGAQINFLRDQGFKQLEPLREGAWAESAAVQLKQLRPEPPARLRDGKPVEPVAPSLPGFAPPGPAPIEPLIILGQQVKEARERRRMEFQRPAAPPA